VERNPYYWKVDRENQRLPYLDELVFLFVGTEDAQVMRFEAGETDIISRLSSENYNLLSREKTRNSAQLADMGPSLEYNFLLFNLNDLSGKKLDEVAGKQVWFRDLKFRQAISAVVDRDSIVRLVYGNRGAALWGMWVQATSSGSIRPSASGTVGRNCASVSESCRVLVESSRAVAGYGETSGRIHHYHQLVEQPAHEDGYPAAGRSFAAWDASACGSP